MFLRFFYKISELFQKWGFSFSSPLSHGVDSIAIMNRFNPATFMFLSQARIYNSIGLYRNRLFVLLASIFASVFLRFFYYILELFQQYGISFLMVVILLQQWIGLTQPHLCFCPKLGFIIPLDMSWSSICLSQAIIYYLAGFYRGPLCVCPKLGFIIPLDSIVVINVSNS